MVREEYIFLNTDFKSKDEVFKFVCKKSIEFGITKNELGLYQDLLNREKEFSTGLSDGYAIPHARSNNVERVAVMFIRNNNELEWETLDGGKVNSMFVLLVPFENEGNVHLMMISKLATCLLDDDFKDKVKSSNNARNLKEYILKEIKEV